jgi:hypothetical protein
MQDHIRKHLGRRTSEKKYNVSHFQILIGYIAKSLGKEFGRNLESNPSF